ncbi:hypothetical protein RFI_27425, partial [Reticulomyxa filosa]
QLSANFHQTIGNAEYNLQNFGFEKVNNKDWYYLRDIQILYLWNCYRKWINTQLIYKTKLNIPEKIFMLRNGKWKEYEIAFDYEYRRIVLFDNVKLKVKSLQVGNPKKLSLEFNVHIQWYNDLSDVENTCSKRFCLILNHTWHFRSFDSEEREKLSDCCSEFNSFNVIWKDMLKQSHKEPFNPYSITLEQGIQHLKDKLQIQEHALNGADELILFNCEFDNYEPPLSSNLDQNILLHNIYKHLPHYPNIQVYWQIKGGFIVPYKRTIGIERSNLPKGISIQDIVIPSSQKRTFNPFLYECDLHKLKIIEDNLHSIKPSSNNELKLLFHEVIKNDYLTDLVCRKLRLQGEEVTKQQINYNEKSADELILSDKILTILNELKILFHDDIHKQMGYPLQFYHICAVLLYCGRASNIQFSCDQIQFKHYKWPHLDQYLCDAISILHKYERREENDMELYCGLKGVRLENIEKKIKAGNFISHVSTSDDIELARMYRSDQGCILHFHPSMRRASTIDSCDVSWISPFKHEREILFSRSWVSFIHDEKTHKELLSWNAKVESEDEFTQMLLLTWVKYDEFINQTLEISSIWNYRIDLNLIYVALYYYCKRDIDKTYSLLFEFEEWKSKDNNKQKYKVRMDKFRERRCCNDHVNLFCRSDIEDSVINIVNNGLPFVEKDKDIERIKPDL